MHHRHYSRHSRIGPRSSHGRSSLTAGDAVERGPDAATSAPCWPCSRRSRCTRLRNDHGGRGPHRRRLAPERRLDLPTLQLLEDEGLIEGTEAEGKRRFELTEAGREARRALWPSALGRGDGRCRSRAAAARRSAQQLRQAVAQVFYAADEEQRRKVRELLDEIARSTRCSPPTTEPHAWPRGAARFRPWEGDRRAPGRLARIPPRDGRDSMDQPSVDLVALNPQPLPPDANIKLVALNPQPLPPDATIELVALNPQPLPPQATINLVALNPQPLPPRARIRLVALNPQPLPPKTTVDFVALNPQPLPPSEPLNFVAVAAWPPD